MDLCGIKKIFVLTVLTLTYAVSAFGSDNIKTNPSNNQLQDLIDNAKYNSTVTIPEGIYTDPIEIRKPLTLKGISAKKCVLDVISEKPAIFIDTKDKVILEDITIKWQRLTTDRNIRYNAALVITNAQVKLSNCRFFAKEKGARCKSAIEILGTSDVIIDKCLTNGFEITFFFKKGTKGLVSDCVLLEPTRYGISIFPYSKVDVKKSIIIGSEHQGIVNNGLLTIENSLIVNNKNVGIRIQDNNATIRNNVFMNNGVGIVGFKKSEVLLENNVILDSKFSGITASPDSYFTIQNNIIYKNNVGIKVSDSEDDHTNLNLGKNTFWQNNSNLENIKNIEMAVYEDPSFQDIANGDFTIKSNKVKSEKHGLSNPDCIKSLWIALANATEYFVGLAQANEGIIAGKVLDAQGKPVIGAAVIICDQNTGVLINKNTSRPFIENKQTLYNENALDIAYMLTDSQGCFSVNYLKKGEYRIFSQSWKNTKEIKGIFEKNGKVIELHGTAKDIKVPSSGAENLELHPLGNGTLHIMPNNSHLTIISTAPPRADPVLMFWSLGDEFLQSIIGGNFRMPFGETIIHGVPEGKVYVAAYNYDQEPGFGTVTATISENTVTKVDIPVIASWTNAQHQPPERLKPLFNEVVEKQLSLSDLLGEHINIDITYLAKLGDALKKIGPLDRQILISNGNKAAVADILAVFRYANIQQIVREKKRRQEISRLRKLAIAKKGSYEESFNDLYFTIGEKYPSFELKNIDWEKVGESLLPKAKEIKNDEQFGLLCMQLVACLKDNHAYVFDGEANLPPPPLSRFDPGFACLKDDRGKPVVFYIDSNSPAAKAGVKVGMTVTNINGKEAGSAIRDTIRQVSKYTGYSSDRYLQYNAYRWFTRQIIQGTIVKLEMVDTKGKTYKFELPAVMDIRYIPRLPVPNIGIDESANVSWKILNGQIGYIYVRRIRNNLIELLDKAVEQLKHAKGIIIDVRGNSGGGFDFNLAHLNFALEETLPSGRLQFKGPLALLVDARCISAGEGWASWFVANKRARLFGETTAGASSKKITYELKNGLYKIKLPVKFYKGYLDRPIEYYGLKPNVFLSPNAQDLAKKCDTVLKAAKEYLLSVTK